MDDDRVYERRWWALAVLCMSLLLIVLDNTILNVAIPALVRSVDASTSQLQWIVDGYTLVFAGLLLPCGSIGDRFGRKGALGVGLVIFCVGSLCSAFAGSANVLIFTRAFMGVGGALIMPATLSLLTNIFRDPRERARAIGVWAALAGAGGAMGPLIGGVLLAHFWWGAVFLVNVPLTIIALVAGRFLLPDSRDHDAPRLDLVGAGLSVAGLIAVLWGIIEAPAQGWSSPSVITAIVTGLMILTAMVAWELHSDHPMLDVRFFRNPRFSGANAAITLTFFAMFGSMFLIVQYMQIVLGYTALESGVRFLPMAAVMLIVAPLSPRLVERVGTKLVVGSGLIFVSTGLLIASTVPIADGYPRIVLSMSVISLGMGLLMAPATESIMGSLPPAKAGVGSAMNDTTRQIGGALGVAVLGSVLSTFYRPGVDKALQRIGVDAAVVRAAKDSVGGAVDAARTLPPPLQQLVVRASNVQFVNAFGYAVTVGAAVVLVGAVIAFAVLPARPAEYEAEARTDAGEALATLGK